MPNLYSVLVPLAQAVDPYSATGVDPSALMAPSISPAVLVFSILTSIALSALFGWWATLRAEEHGINPWVAFLAGFFLLYIGVRMVPILRRDMIFNKPRQPRPLPPRPPSGPVGPVAQSPAPPAAPAVPRDIMAECPVCGSTTHTRLRNCMSCGAELAAR